MYRKTREEVLDQKLSDDHARHLRPSLVIRCYYRKAQQVRTDIEKRVINAFERCEAIIKPPRHTCISLGEKGTIRRDVLKRIYTSRPSLR